MASPPTPEKKDVLSRLKPQKMLNKKASEMDLQARSLSPPAILTKLSKQLSTRIKKREKGSFYIKDGAISDGVVINRKRVAVSNGKIVPGSHGIDLTDLDPDEDEIQIPMAEGPELVRDEVEDDWPPDDEGTILSMADWEVSIDGGKFDIGPSFRAADFMAELEGTTPAITAELEGTPVPVEAEADSPVMEKEGDSPSVETRSSNAEENWESRPVTPLRQVRHVGHLVRDPAPVSRDIPQPVRKDSVISVGPTRGQTIKGEAERFIAPLFSPVSPMERTNPMDRTSATPSMDTVSIASLASPREQNYLSELAAQRGTAPINQPSSPTSRSTHATPKNSHERICSIPETPKAKKKTKPDPLVDPTRSMESVATPTTLSPARYSPLPSPGKFKAPNEATKSSFLPQRERADTMPNSTRRPSPPLQQQSYFNGRPSTPQEIHPALRTASPLEILRTASPQEFTGSASPHEIIRTTSPEELHPTLCTSPSHEREPVTLSDRPRADTLPVTVPRRPSKAPSQVIRRKELPVRQDSVAYAADADRRRRERDQKAKEKAAEFLRQQKLAEEQIRAQMANRTQAEVDEDEELARERERELARSLTRRNSKGMSWLSL
ncbi:hypothetical protein B0O99DRAFT_687920 [Bisporella sp. PMI_857]|nr:hypothetical protein B0O99DRAFT_687920 [Bisporella sp. PMI_857]